MKCQQDKRFYQQPDRRLNDISYLRKKATAGIMAFGSHRRPVYPTNPPLMPRPSSNDCCPATVQERSYVKEQGPWACDYCQVATFATYEEAARHEENCLVNQNALSVQRNKTYSPQDLQFIHPFNQVSSSVSSQSMTVSLSMPNDEDCLSDRQCYVRKNFVELFIATEEDVASRHSKGAQKLHVNQIGIRCKHCNHRRGKNRAERAVCYPSSISRIYQTVADMQRFHFMACECIPDEMKATYKTLKTTRPRGVGSPQAYWISSAKVLGLVDTDCGIRYDSTNNTEQSSPLPQYPTSTVSSFSSLSTCSTNTNIMTLSPGNRFMNQGQSSPLVLHSTPHLPPLSPESQSTSQSMHEQSDCSDLDMASRDSDAEMLLALKKGSLKGS